MRRSRGRVPFKSKETKNMKKRKQSAGPTFIKIKQKKGHFEGTKTINVSIIIMLIVSAFNATQSINSRRRSICLHVQG